MINLSKIRWVHVEDINAAATAIDNCRGAEIGRDRWVYQMDGGPLPSYAMSMGGSQYVGEEVGSNTELLATRTTASTGAVEPCQLTSSKSVHGCVPPQLARRGITYWQLIPGQIPRFALEETRVIPAPRVRTGTIGGQGQCRFSSPDAPKAQGAHKHRLDFCGGSEFPEPAVHRKPMM